MKNEKKHINLGEKAITLIALVVTIVILLILAGVTITMTLKENGLFTKARAGRAAYEEASVKEDLSMLTTQYVWDKVAGNTDKSLGDYLKDNGATSVNENGDNKTLIVEYKGYTLTVDKNSGEIDKFNVKIGDIVKYEPDTPDTGYELNPSMSGWDDTKTIDSRYDPQIWKVLELDDNGNITKLLGVSGSNQKMIYFKGTIGYNNWVYLLNDICAKRYSSANLNASARSLTIEDIEAQMNDKGILAKNNYISGTVQYGTTRKFEGD